MQYWAVTFGDGSFIFEGYLFHLGRISPLLSPLSSPPTTIRVIHKTICWEHTNDTWYIKWTPVENITKYLLCSSDKLICCILIKSWFSSKARKQCHARNSREQQCCQQISQCCYCYRLCTVLYTDTRYAKILAKFEWRGHSNFAKIFDVRKVRLYRLFCGVRRCLRVLIKFRFVTARLTDVHTQRRGAHHTGC